VWTPSAHTRIPAVLFQDPKNRSAPNNHFDTPKNQVAPMSPRTWHEWKNGYSRDEMKHRNQWPNLNLIARQTV
jgi:hypothetical protein